MISRGKLGVAIAALAAAALILTGCSGGGGAKPATGTLKFYTDKGAWKPDFEGLNGGSKKSIDISLKVAGYSDENQYQAFIKQSFRTKESPGLFTWATGPSLKQLVDDKLVADTSDIWKNAIQKGWVSKDLEKYYTFGGKQYCVPLNIAYWVMYYNKKLFDENGISQAPTTWKQLNSDAATLKAAGVTPYYQTSNLFTFQWFQQLVAGTSPKLYDDLITGKAKYTDPRIVSLMKTWEDQEKKGWFSDAGSSTAPEVMLKNGQFAMINFGTFFSGSLKSVGMKPGTDYGTFVIPAVDPSSAKNAVAVETGPLCVAQTSSQRAMGLAYSKWWMGPDAQSAWGSARGDVPFNTKAKVSDQSLADLGKGVASDDQLVTRYFDAVPTDVLNVALEQFGAFIANPGDPMPYLQKIQAVADTAYAK